MMAKQIKLSKAKKKEICGWFFDVVEAQRAINKLSTFKIGGIPIMETCEYSKTIQILGADGFDRLVESLVSEFDEHFVGKVTNEVSKGIEDKPYIWRSFKYAEFTIGTIVRDMEGV